MQDSTFIGLDVHKTTISVAIAQGGRGGEVHHFGTVPHRPDHVRKPVEKQAGRGCISAMRRVPAAMVCIVSSSRWDMTVSWWPRR